METIQMLGSLGEFVGAIAVVATLVYLAIQVRHSKEAMEANTRSMDESRSLALAQTYQARAAAWADIGLPGPARPPFRAEIERILAESEENEQ